MPAHVIFIRERMRDAEMFEAYTREARSTVAGHDIELLASNGECLTMEGGHAEAVLILSFQNMAAARAWYDSPAYTDVRAKRQLSADYRVIIAQGI